MTPSASDGVAAMMPANCTQWAVQYPIPASVANESPVHCYVRVRCDATNQSGTACILGIWDNSANAAVTQESVLYQNGAGNGQYQVYDLGVYNLTTSMYVSVAPPGSAQATPAVYVDYISFARAPVIANNGKTSYSIVVGNNATITDSTAATELPAEPGRGYGSNASHPYREPGRVEYAKNPDRTVRHSAKPSPRIQLERARNRWDRDR